MAAPKANHNEKHTTPPRRPTLHTRKEPDACPRCHGKKLTRKGTRQKKLEVVQLWRCTSCERVFTPAAQPLQGKTYPARLILEALTLYNLGHSRAETIKLLKSKFGHRVSPAALSQWIKEYRDLATYHRLRDRGRRLFKPVQTLHTVKLYHRQVYEFGYHRPKLAMLLEDPEHKRFAPLADFLEAVPTTCPHTLFRESSRASQSKPDYADPANAIVVQKENAATRTAGLVIPTVGNNHRRHDVLQRFMLANDSTTVAVEVPIWLSPKEVSLLEEKYGVPLRADGDEGPITGHIDFVQVRNGAVHILDYKPDARTNRPLAQLTIYAVAVAHRAGLRLFDIKCAWFNEHEYCEFFPRKLLSHVQARKKGRERGP